MNVPSTDYFRETRWKVIQWGCFLTSLVCMLILAFLWNAGRLHLFDVITLGFVAFVVGLVGFVTWHLRWYYSDARVTALAKKAVKKYDSHLHTVIYHHPRREDIRREILRQRSQ